MLSIKDEIFIQFISMVPAMLKLQRAIYILGKNFPRSSNVYAMIINYLFIVLEYESEIWKLVLL